MKTVLQIVLWIVCVLLGYLIYRSVTGPIEFDKIKKERFAEVIDRLKDIRNAQEAYRSVNGRYSNDFESLVSFVDTGKYVITTQRDSSYMEYDKTYGIDMLKEVKIIDTLGYVAVKDSLFGGTERYKNLMKVPHAANNETFTMKADFLEQSGYRAPVFEAKVAKNVILSDQPADLLARENSQVSVEEVNGSEIKVGSLTKVSTSGNWPPIYDKKGEQQ
jgi:type II secretory pathway pseudopilin PulG